MNRKAKVMNRIVGIYKAEIYEYENGDIRM